jgi:DNA-directed RNA polymerase beta subunit
MDNKIESKEYKFKDPYDGLDEKGYLPPAVDALIKNGDIIIGRVRPMDENISHSGYFFKDSSELYKRYNDHVVTDRVFSPSVFKNNDEYKINKISIRSEKVPRVGDMICSSYSARGLKSFDEQNQKVESPINKILI